MIKMNVLSVLTVCAVLMAPAMGAGAEEKTITAYAPWMGRGQLVPTGEGQVTFVGSFTGIMFVEMDKQVTSSGNMICPGMIRMNLQDGSQTGQGQCTLSNNDGERIYAEWICSGKVSSGCDGKFKLVSGTGGYSGITGDGDFIVRSGLHENSLSGGGNVIRGASAGLAIWRNLHYKIPDNQ